MVVVSELRCLVANVGSGLSDRTGPSRTGLVDVAVCGVQVVSLRCDR